MAEHIFPIATNKSYTTPLTTIHPLWAICLCSGGWRKYCDTEMAISHEIKTNCSCCSCRYPVLNTNIPGLGGGCSWTGIKLRPIPYVMAQMAHLLLLEYEWVIGFIFPVRWNPTLSFPHSFVGHKKEQQPPRSRSQGTTSTDYAAEIYCQLNYYRPLLHRLL